MPASSFPVLICTPVPDWFACGPLPWRASRPCKRATTRRDRCTFAPMRPVSASLDGKSCRAFPFCSRWWKKRRGHNNNKTTTVTTTRTGACVWQVSSWLVGSLPKRQMLGYLARSLKPGTDRVNLKHDDFCIFYNRSSSSIFKFKIICLTIVKQKQEMPGLDEFLYFSTLSSRKSSTTSLSRARVKRAITWVPRLLHRLQMWMNWAWPRGFGFRSPPRHRCDSIPIHRHYCCCHCPYAAGVWRPPIRATLDPSILRCWMPVWQRSAPAPRPNTRLPTWDICSASAPFAVANRSIRGARLVLQ